MANRAPTAVLGIVGDSRADQGGGPYSDLGRCGRFTLTPGDLESPFLTSLWVYPAPSGAVAVGGRGRAVAEELVRLDGPSG